MLINAGCTQINKTLNAKVVVLPYPTQFRNRFKKAKRFFKFFVIPQIKMRIQELMNSFNIMPGFNSNHFRIAPK